MFFAFLGTRLCAIQVLNSDFFKKLAHSQHCALIDIRPQRGIIFDRTRRPLAMNFPVYSAYCHPNKLQHIDKSHIKDIARLLEVDADELYQKMNSGKNFVWVKRFITEETMEKVGKDAGIEYFKDEQRIYPNGQLGSHILGCVDVDGNGIEGLELEYERYLRGRTGWLSVLRDSKRRFLYGLETRHPPVNGHSLISSIDAVIQHVAEKELKKAVEASHAKGGSVIVMDPFTGEILALANYPHFDSNNARKASFDAMRNRAICDVYEPGSCFKPITAAAALEERAVNETQEFFCENGSLRIANRTLHDHRPHGTLTFREVIVLSSNIGTYKVASLLGKDRLAEYIRKFGFGEKTGIDLPGEVSGIFRAPKTWQAIDMGTIPMGQGVGVTAIQMACALSAIANGGFLLEPKTVLKVEDEFGNTIESFREIAVRNRVISYEASERLRNILVDVVENGTGKLARIKGVKVAGKTGTAQKLEPDGSYSHRKYIASFIGFAPADRPTFVVIATLDEPWPRYYGGSVAAPLFKEVMEQALEYCGVMPQSEETAARLLVRNN